MSKAFPFFRLPPELRDRIYESVGGREVEFKLVLSCKRLPTQGLDAATTFSYTACIQSAPRVNVLLVSRSTKEEYAAEIHRHTSFEVRDDQRTGHLGQYNLSTDDKLRKYLQKIPSLRLTLDLTRYSAQDSLNQSSMKHAAARDLLTQLMTNLKILRDDTHVISSPHLESEEITEAKNELNHQFRAYLKNKTFDVMKGGQCVRTIDFDYHLFFHQQLFSMLPTYEPTEAEKANCPLLVDILSWEEICGHLNRHVSNKIVYEVTPSSDPGAALDFEHRFVSAGNLDLDESTAYFEGVLRSVMSEQARQDRNEVVELEEDSEDEEDWEDDDAESDEDGDSDDEIEDGSESEGFRLVSSKGLEAEVEAVLREDTEE